MAVTVCLSDLPASAASLSNQWLARTWQTEEGLPDNSVTGLAQTDDGFLWVATLGGLMRFDGAQFKEVPLLNVPGVANRVVRKMFLDRRGRLWLAMDRGSVLCVGPDGARVYNQQDGLEDSRISDIQEDGAGNIWLVSSSCFYRIKNGKVFRFGAEQGVPGGGNPWLAIDSRGDPWFVRGIHVGRLREDQWQEQAHFDETPVRLHAADDGSMWLCTGAGIFKCEADGGLRKCADLPEKSVVTMLFQDHAGALWIGTLRGLFRLGRNGLERVGTSHEEILCALRDREENLWVGTAGGGLDVLSPRAVNLVGTRSGLPSESIRSVCLARNGCFWAALNNGTLARGRSNDWQAVTAADGWPGGNATCVAAGADGGVWVGTRDRGLEYFHDGSWRQWDRNDGLGSTFIHALLVARGGTLWIGAHSPDRLVRFRNGRFQFFEPPDQSRVIRALAEGTNGTIWAGTSGGWLLRVTGGKLIRDPDWRESRLLSIRSLHVTPDGSLWIGYAGWGVGRLWNGRYARVGMDDGLYDDYISQIQSDDRGGLWFTSNHGLFQVRQQELETLMAGRSGRVRCIRYGRSEGLPSLQPAFDFNPSTCRSGDGDLWFATHNGLLHVQPALIRDNTNPPPVVLEQVTVDDRPVAIWEGFPALQGGPDGRVENLRAEHSAITLPPGHRKVEFAFAALSYASPENVSFRYRLKNFDEDWIDAGDQRTAKYPRLPAGRYEFQVQACNNAGVWNEAGERLRIRVRPFFWQQWWFRVLVLAVFTACLAGLVRYFSFRRLQRRLTQLEQQAALQKERTRIARDMHDEVGAKLSRLSLLSELAGQQTNLPAPVRGDVTEISETARDTIRSFEQIVWAVNPKNDTLANLAHYLCRFAEDLFDGTSVECAFSLPEPIPEMTVSTELRHNLFLATKEALNNIFKHARATQVQLRLAMAADGFEVIIEDDGCGFVPGDAEIRPGTGNGLENMQARMDTVGGQMEIQSGPGAGTTVVFRVRCGGAGDGVTE